MAFTITVTVVYKFPLDLAHSFSDERGFKTTYFTGHIHRESKRCHYSFVHNFMK